MARNNETPIRVGLLGAGTVGSQTARLIVEQKDELSARIGRPVELTGVACLDPKETEKFPWIDQSIVTTDTLSVATNSDIVIELIGGTTVARKFVLAAIGRLIPEDEYGPGGVSEGVPVFIDKQMELPYGHGHLWYMQGPFASAEPELGYQSSLVPRDTWRRGIAAVNAHCRKQQNKAFAELSAAQQDDLLHQLEGGKLTFDSVDGKLFFTQMLENAKEGYFADPLHGGNQTLASWKLIGFPGARADYQQVMDNPGKPYPLGPVSISGKRSV